MEITPALWLLVLTVGVIALGAAMLYARQRNKMRTPAEKARTDAATRDQYQIEESDRG